MARSYNFYVNTGATRNYGYGSPANGPDANLDSHPLGDLYQGLYSGLDEDNVGGDCSKWNAAGHAATTNMQTYSVSYPYATQAQVHLSGSAANPLEPGPAIVWNMNVVVDDSNPASPTAYVNYSHTCYPAHIIKVNGAIVYTYLPSGNSEFYLAACLFQAPGHGLVTGVSATVPVQPQ